MSRGLAHRPDTRSHSPERDPGADRRNFVGCDIPVPARERRGLLAETRPVTRCRASPGRVVLVSPHS